ncbi:unnamed protein product [Closterium sp. Naga37s-1]|nr:unnamed protein product [Closterium sp. Naga37s-1]
MVRMKNGRPALKCAVCLKHADPTANTNYGIKGEGGRDLQLGSIRAHLGTRAHKSALKAEADAEKEKAQQATLTRWQTTDAATRHLIRCLHVAIEALSAKDAALAVPDFNMVDKVVRGLADLLGRSHVDVTLVAHLVEQTRMRNTKHYLTIESGQSFGEGDKMQLPAFLAAYESTEKREVRAEGVDADDNPSTTVFILHERLLKGYNSGSDVTACYELATSYAREVNTSLGRRMRDLDKLEGTKLSER